MLAVDLRSKQPTPAGTGPTDFFAVPRTDRDPDPMGNPGDVRAIHAESVQGVADRCGQVGDRRRWHLTEHVQPAGAGHPRRGVSVGRDGAVEGPTSTCYMSDFVVASNPGCRFSYLIYRRVGPYQISRSGWIRPWHINRALVGRAREIATSSPSDRRRKLAECSGNVLELLGCSLRSTARRSFAKPSGCPSLRLPRRFQMRRSPPCRLVSPPRRTSRDPKKTKPHTPKSVWPLQRVKGFDPYYLRESTHARP
jgi:hypothetical protein